MNWDQAGILAGGLCVIGIYSFLYKENAFYRFFEHLFIGVATGFGMVLVVSHFLWPDYIKVKFGFDLQPWQEYNRWNLLWILPAVYGCLIYFMLSKKHVWLARLVIGLSLGLGGGLYFKGFFMGFLPDVVNSFKPLVVYRAGPGGASLDWFEMAENLLFMATLVCVMTYFFFSLDYNRPAFDPPAGPGRAVLTGVRGLPSVAVAAAGGLFGLLFVARLWPSCPTALGVFAGLLCAAGAFLLGFKAYAGRPLLGQVAVTGRYLMMITFGAFFGATVMARMALLIDRLQFLAGDWFDAVGRLVGG